MNVCVCQAFIQFKTHAEAELALDSPRAVCGNRFITVTWAFYDRPDLSRTLNAGAPSVNAAPPHPVVGGGGGGGVMNNRGRGRGRENPRGHPPPGTFRGRGRGRGLSRGAFMMPAMPGRGVPAPFPMPGVAAPRGGVPMPGVHGVPPVMPGGGVATPVPVGGVPLPPPAAGIGQEVHFVIENGADDDVRFCF